MQPEVTSSAFMILLVFASLIIVSHRTEPLGYHRYLELPVAKTIDKILFDFQIECLSKRYVPAS